MPTSRLVIWEGTDEWRAEADEVELSAEGMRAHGTQVGADPLPYRLDFNLDAAAGWVTRSLEVDVRGDGWARRLILSRGDDGTWRIDATATGRATGLPEPGGDARLLQGAVDCDLGRSPLTNALPVRRLGLLDAPGEHEIVVAWVSVPDLTVHPSVQRYRHEHRDEVGTLVTFVAGTFRAELNLDRDGIVAYYPELARLAVPSA